MFSSPSLSIYEDGRIQFIKGVAYFIHCFDIMYTHEIESKAVQMIFFCPIEYGFNHEATHHGSFRSCFIVASRSVSISSVRTFPEEIIWSGTLEITPFDIKCMVVNNVKNHSNSR